MATPSAPQQPVERLAPRELAERDRDDRLRALALHKATEITISDGPEQRGVGKGALTADRAKVLYGFLTGADDTKGGDQ